MTQQGWGLLTLVPSVRILCYHHECQNYLMFLQGDPYQVLSFKIFHSSLSKDPQPCKIFFEEGYHRFSGFDTSSTTSFCF